MCAFRVVAGVALASAAAGLRKTKVTEQVQTKVIADVPIYNYDLRNLQHSGVAASASNENDWVVMFEKGQGDAQLETFCAGSCRVSGHPSKKGVPFVTVRGTEEKLRGMLKANPTGLSFAEPDLPVFPIPEIAVQTETADHWGLDRIDLSRAGSTGKGVHIYVMDTGTRVSHSDFGGRAVATIDTILGDGTPIECQNSDDPACGQDTNGHGTHTAGTAGGTEWGVARDSIVHGMKVCCGAGTNTIAGMDWILQNAERPAIMTMSLGSYGQSMTAKAAVDLLVDAGIAVFVSAGNNDIDSCGKTYAFIESTITVGASDQEDSRAWFSNWGSCLDIYAPGVSIPSASNRDDTGITLKSGTSMATPMVAGAGALLLEQNPGMSPAQLKAQLIGMASEDVLDDMKASDPNLLLNVR